MSKIRVLVVDDVAMVRRLVVDALSIDPDIQVVGTAANGREAIDRIPEVKPDLIVLDYEMPEMDGLETLIEVRKNHPAIRVIIFSSHTRHGAKVTLDALWHGADDYVPKSPADNLTAATALIRTQLIPKIKGLCGGSENGNGEGAPAPSRRGADETPLPGIADPELDPDPSRDRRHRRVDGRAEGARPRPRGVAPGFPDPDRDRAAHAADLHAGSWPSGSARAPSSSAPKGSRARRSSHGPSGSLPAITT